MKSDFPKILLIGYGNPARCDDGLGPALAAKLEATSIQGLTIESDYQLTVEDAHDVSRHDIVIFADAALEVKEPFSFYEIMPQSPVSFSTHSVTPEAVLSFAQNIFRSRVRAYMLGIRGYEFNRFGERLSEKAESNLEKAFVFIEQMSRASWTGLLKRNILETR